MSNRYLELIKVIKHGTGKLNKLDYIISGLINFYNI